MKNLFKVVLAFAGTLLCLSASYADSNHPTTFLGPTLRGTYTDIYDACTAYSVAGEVGLKNFRVGGTVGWRATDKQWLKVSAEYLLQRITYPFFFGNQDEWVQQGAIGAFYQYHFFNACWDPTVDIRAWYSHAPSKSLNTKHGFFTNAAGIVQSFADHRRIAGSNAGGITPGITFHPWGGTVFGLDLNWDDVQYDKNHSPQEDAKGFGGTARLSQVITDDILLDLSAAIRQPFNNYAASINWVNVSFFGKWSLGLIGDYTAGKHTLPSTWDVGINANYFVDHACDSACMRRAAAQFANLNCADNFLAWTSDPAVYLPQVLAIPDEDVVIPDPQCSATPPTVIGTIADAVVGATPVTRDGAAAFSPSSGLTYSVSVSPALTPPSSVTINSSTGLITITNGEGVTRVVTITVTATNVCGATASTTFTATLTGIG